MKFKNIKDFAVNSFKSLKNWISGSTNTDESSDAENQENKTIRTMKELFADNSYLTHAEKPKVILGIGMKGNVIGYNDKLMKTNALSFKALVQRCDNVKLITCTTGTYPNDKKDQDKLHNAFISCGISEAYFLGGIRKHITVTKDGMKEEKLSGAINNKGAAYLDMVERYEIAKPNMVIMDEFAEMMMMYERETEDELPVVTDIVLACQKAQSKAQGLIP